VRGRPLSELIFVALLGAALCFPLHRLTRPRSAPGPEALLADFMEGDREPVWMDVRFSHAPEQVEVFQGEVLLAEGGGDLRWDEDVALIFDGDVTVLRIGGRFAEEIESAYVEITLEPEGRRPLRRGIWTRGEFSHTMEFRWTEN
jgi:hypothetical protein